jgi:hypothetical protein
MTTEIPDTPECPGAAGGPQDAAPPAEELSAIERLREKVRQANARSEANRLIKEGGAPGPAPA